jgi:ATP-dependent Lon protease
VCRGIASKIAEGTAQTIVVGQKDLYEYLGHVSNMPDLALKIDNPGVVVGLAWTPYGGEILFIEAVAMEGGKGLTLTGQLGDVMKESASTALSYIRARAKKLNMDESFFSRHDIHIHVPEGSIPKDGPSAGVAMLTALASLITGRMVKKRLAMSGEITLRGEVLPVGGIKEKVIAAHRAGIRTIILPLWNQKDMDDVPDYIKNSIEFLFTDKMENLLDLALD